MTVSSSLLFPVLLGFLRFFTHLASSGRSSHRLLVLDGASTNEQEVLLVDEAETCGRISMTRGTTKDRGKRSGRALGGGCLVLVVLGLGAAPLRRRNTAAARAWLSAPSTSRGCRWR